MRMMTWKEPSDLKAWQQEGEPEILAKGFGKQLRQQGFYNPATGKTEQFVLFGQRDWSVILPITGNGQVIAVRQYKQGCNNICIELPAGTADFKDEEPHKVAERELLEETGFEASEVVFLGHAQWIASRSSWTRFWPFVAFGCTKVKPAKIDSNEEIETLVFELEDWVKFCLTQLEEPSAGIATFRALPCIKRRFPNVGLSEMLEI